MSSHTPQIRNLDQRLDWERLCGLGPVWGSSPWAGPGPLQDTLPAASCIHPADARARRPGVGLEEQGGRRLCPSGSWPRESAPPSLTPAWQRLRRVEGVSWGEGSCAACLPKVTGQFGELELPHLPPQGDHKWHLGSPAESSGGMSGAWPPLGWVRRRQTLRLGQ